MGKNITQLARLPGGWRLRQSRAMNLKGTFRRSRLGFFLFALVLAAAAPGWAAPPVPQPAPPAPKTLALPLGKLVERVPCAGHPEQTYALYLPRAYTPE